MAEVPFASADPPSAPAGPCSNVEVIFARGTTEAPGVGGIGQAFIDSLQSRSARSPCGPMRSITRLLPIGRPLLKG
jgi:hypothetical protein